MEWFFSFEPPSPPSLLGLMWENYFGRCKNYFCRWKNYFGRWKNYPRASPVTIGKKRPNCQCVESILQREKVENNDKKKCEKLNMAMMGLPLCYCKKIYQKLKSISKYDNILVWFGLFWSDACLRPSSLQLCT